MCCRELITRRGVSNPAPNLPYFGPCAIQFLLKISRQAQISHSVDTSVRIHKCHIFSAPPPSSFCCLQPRRGEERTSFVANYLRKQTRREQLEEKFSSETLLLLKFDTASENEPTVRGLNFLASFARLWNCCFVWYN